jgi:hypothetical protein
MVSSTLRSNEWRVLPVESTDITAISVTGEFGTLRIFNCYIEGDSNRGLEVLHTFLQKFPKTHCTKQPAYDIIAGDTNRHHPMWELLENHHLFTRRNMRLAEPLLELIERQGLDMPLPAAIPTLEAMNTKNLTRPDNVFCSVGLTPKFVVCRVDRPNQPPKTDHFPVLMHLDLRVERGEPVITKNYRQVDWEEFRKELKKQLDSIPPPREIEDERDFYEAWAAFDGAVKETVEKVVPDTKVTPYNKRWWTPELGDMKRRLNGLGKKWCHGRVSPTIQFMNSGGGSEMTTHRPSGRRRRCVGRSSWKV